MVPYSDLPCLIYERFETSSDWQNFLPNSQRSVSREASMNNPFPNFIIPSHFENYYTNTNGDGLIKSRQIPFFVIPAEAGIQLFQDVLDPGFRRGDDPPDFLRVHQT